jgi:hypothetical protein
MWRDTLLGELFEAAQLDVSSVCGLPPFGAVGDARRGNPAWDTSHMLVFPHTHPSEMVLLDLKCADSVSWYACSLKGLGASSPPFELDGSVHGYIHQQLEKYQISVTRKRELNAVVRRESSAGAKS